MSARRSDDQLRQAFERRARATAPEDLRMRILSAADRTPQVAAPRRLFPSPAGRPVLRVAYLALLLAALAALAAAAVFIGSRLDRGILTSEVPPSPSALVVASAGPSASSAPSVAPSASSAPSGVPSPTAVPSEQPIGAWTGLQLSRVEGGPTDVLAFTAWSEGYFAIGAPTSDGQVTAWTSPDGRSWTTLPSGIFPAAYLAAAAPFGDGLIVIADGDLDTTQLLSSADGVTWTQAADTSPGVAALPMASTAAGLVAIPTRDGTGLLFKAAGSDPAGAWEPIALPNQSRIELTRVAAFDGEFVALGTERSGGGAAPVVFTSTDGRTWTAGSAASRQADGFTMLAPGADGLAALSSTVDVTPGTTRFWTSTDGARWTRSVADPLGSIASGEGDGGAAGLIVGDGSHILVFGDSGRGRYEFWTSTDGAAWTRLRVSGDTSGAVDAQANPHLLRDGILFDTQDGTWVGTAVGG